MKFKSFFGIFVGLALISVTIDFLITVVGFSRYFAFMEINPHIMFLMRYMRPYLAASTVFVVTLAFVLGSHWLVRGYFEGSPYDGGVRKVWRYLLDTASVKRRDLVIFALMALFIYFTYIHLMGVKSWVDLFMKYGW